MVDFFRRDRIFYRSSLVLSYYAFKRLSLNSFVNVSRCCWYLKLIWSILPIFILIINNVVDIKVLLTFFVNYQTSSLVTIVAFFRKRRVFRRRRRRPHHHHHQIYHFIKYRRCCLSLNSFVKVQKNFLRRRYHRYFGRRRC